MQILTEAMLRSCGIYPEDKVLVAFSGGADSTALLLLMRQALSDGWISGLAAAHLNHGIRGEHADADEAFCCELCRKYAVKLMTERMDIPARAALQGETLEEAARNARYDFLQRCEKACGASCIAVAHHREDQAETVFMHLLRGCGITGLSGMRLRNGDVVRPLLPVSRAQIEAYLHELEQPYCTDATNFDTDATRNYIRLQVMPMLTSLNPNAAETLCRMARTAAEDEAFFERLVEQAEPGVTLQDGYLRTELQRLATPVRKRLIRKALLQLDHNVTQSDIERIDALIGAQTGTKLELRNGNAAWVDARCLYIGKYPQFEPFEIALCIPGETVFPGGKFRTEWVEQFQKPLCEDEAFVDADRLPAHPVVRSRKSGDRFQPMGAPGDRKLSDVLTDRKIPLARRDAIPLLAAENRIYYAAGVGTAQQVRVDRQTKRILHIVYCRG